MAITAASPLYRRRSFCSTCSSPRSREPIGWYRGLDHAAASRRRKLSLRFAGTHGRGWDSPRKPITCTRYTRRLAPPRSPSLPPQFSTHLPANLVNGPPPLFLFSPLSVSLSPRWRKESWFKGLIRRVIKFVFVLSERSLFPRFYCNSYPSRKPSFAIRGIRSIRLIRGQKDSWLQE